MKWLERLKNVEVILIATALLGAGAGFMIWFNSEIGPVKAQGERTAAEVASLKADMIVTNAKADDALDARIEYVYGQIVRLLDKWKEKGELSHTERDYLKTQQQEHERLKKLRYGQKDVR